MPQAGFIKSKQILEADIAELIQALPAATLLCHSDGCILFANKAADQLLRCQVSYLPSTRITAFIPDFAPAFPAVTDLDLILQDGTVLCASVEVSHLSGPNLLLITLTKMPAGKPPDREPPNWQDIIALAPAVFCSFGMDATGAFLTPRSADEFAALLGIRATYLEEDLTELYSLIRSEERENIQAAVSLSQSTMTRWRAEFRIPHSSGEERWIEAHFLPASTSSTSIIWHGFLHDITAQKTSEIYRTFLLELGSRIQRAPDSAAIASTGTAMLAEYFSSASCCLSSIHLARMESTLIHQHVAGAPSSHPGPRPITAWGNDAMLRELLAGESVVVDNTATHPFTCDKFDSFFGPAGVYAFTIVPLMRGRDLAAIISLSEKAPRARPNSDALLIRAAADRIWPAYEAAYALASQRATLQRLTASEDRLGVALHAAAIGIWEADHLTGKRTLDDRCHIMNGFAIHEPLDREILLSRIVPEDRELFRRKAVEYGDPSGTGHFKMEYRIVSPLDGRLRYILAQGQMMFENHGLSRRPIRSVGTMQDVTPLKQGEQALRRANAELESFAYAAAHDLQEPLRNIALAAQLLASHYPSQADPEPARLLAIASDGARRMEAMVKDLLGYSKILTLDETGASSANANLVLARVLGQMKSEIRQSGAIISWDVLPIVAMKAVHLAPVLQHLLSNALKFTAGRTLVVHIGSKTFDQQTVIFVKDNGCGIPEDFHERIFGVFKRLHSPDVPGTGMGLAICKRIVEHYGGRIWIESEIGVGATVLFSVKTI